MPENTLIQKFLINKPKKRPIVPIFIVQNCMFANFSLKSSVPRIVGTNWYMAPIIVIETQPINARCACAETVPLCDITPIAIATPMVTASKK